MRSIIYIFIYVRDLQISRAFYEINLGLNVLEEGQGFVKYDVGTVILALNVVPASPGPVHPDDTSMIVFHVEDIDVMRQNLERKGVSFSGAISRYEIGATATFYDPDGHCYCLYQPSTEAMTWPSGGKLRFSVSTYSSVGQISGALQGSSKTDASVDLSGHVVTYLFLFIGDVEEAAQFYEEKLGLSCVERDSAAGVAKYDVGGFLLATHLVESEPTVRARSEDLKRHKDIAPVFQVSQFETAYNLLQSRGVKFREQPVTSAIGRVIRFSDPNGHIFYLYEASQEALTWPSGKKLLQLAS
jgi:predicted enzyme related to lactoylglutathione lyase